jgi:hypothetical protein
MMIRPDRRSGGVGAPGFGAPAPPAAFDSVVGRVSPDPDGCVVRSVTRTGSHRLGGLMHRSRAFLAVILVAAGLVWIGQGTGLIRGRSFMTDDLRWAAIGAACVIAGVIVGLVEVRRRRA